MVKIDFLRDDNGDIKIEVIGSIKDISTSILILNNEILEKIETEIKKITGEKDKEAAEKYMIFIKENIIASLRTGGKNEQ